jgi:hypothetical protein
MCSGCVLKSPLHSEEPTASCLGSYVAVNKNTYSIIHVNTCMYIFLCVYLSIYLPIYIYLLPGNMCYAFLHRNRVAAALELVTFELDL